MNLPQEKMRAAALCLPLLLGAAQSAHAQDWSRANIEVNLHASSVVHSSQVLLGDIATIHTQDANAIRQLVALPMGSAPEAGAHAVLERDAIARWLRTRLGVMRGHIEWSGAEEVRVIGGAELAAINSPAVTIGNAQIRTQAGAVNRGDWVQLLVKSGAVHLESRGQALQDGADGQVILIRASSAAGPVYARVVGIGKVEALP